MCGCPAAVFRSRCTGTVAPSPSVVGLTGPTAGKGTRTLRENGFPHVVQPGAAAPGLRQAAHHHSSASATAGDGGWHPTSAASPTHVTNPIVIVEVLGEKREHYQQIASLREYVLVAQDRREIEVYTRPTGGSWQSSVYRAAQTVDLPSIGIQFTVDELYNAAGVP